MLPGGGVLGPWSVHLHTTAAGKEMGATCQPLAWFTELRSGGAEGLGPDTPQWAWGGDPGQAALIFSPDGGGQEVGKSTLCA